mmetsp:Transcript_103492/g.163360  ORF Transcript_103492/g.163360 Transcript_103492/m.163360 type:complete len:1044 (-) Transcript_103492:77-3208(-)
MIEENDGNVDGPISPARAEQLEEAPEPEAEANCEVETQSPGDIAVDEYYGNAAHGNGSPQSQDGGDVRRMCPYCGRHFIPSSLERHQRVCQKVFRSTRPQFDAMKGSTIFSNSASVRVNLPKQEPQPPTSSGPLSRSSSDLGPQALHSGLRSQSSRKSCALSASDKKLPTFITARGSSPKGSIDLSFESIEDHEQRVMNLLQQQLEDLRDMRRQCGQSQQVSCKDEGTSVANAARCLSPQSPKSVCNMISAQDVSAASESLMSRRSSNDKNITLTEEFDTSTDLKICEDCGRRFNPASFEKHRAVCRTVFGKRDRAPFESQRQRLRSLQVGLAVSPLRNRAPSRETLYPSVGEGGATSSFGAKGNTARKTSSGLSPKAGFLPSSSLQVGSAVESPEASAHILEDSSRDCISIGLMPTRLTSPQRPLMPCPHCGRSFRQAALDKHVKVCQRVFPTHDARTDQRYVYDSRRHRLKGTACEAYSSISPSRLCGDRACSSTPPIAFPPRTRGRSPKAPLVRTFSESHIPASCASSSTSPVAPSATASDMLHFPWRHEVEEKEKVDQFGCLMDSRADGLEATWKSTASSIEAHLRSASPEDCKDVRRFLEERRGKLERARLDMKISQNQDRSEQTSPAACEKKGSFSRESSVTEEASSRFTFTRRQCQQDLGPTRSSTCPSANLGSSQETISLSEVTRQSSQEGALHVLGSGNPLPFTAGCPLSKATTLQAPTEVCGNSPEIDLRSYYERCLEHLDSIGESKLATSISESMSTLPVEHTVAKPGLGREDPISETPSRTIARVVVDESCLCPPAYDLKGSHDRAQLDPELVIEIAEAAVALRLEPSQPRFETDVDRAGQSRPNTPMSISLKAQFGSLSNTPLDRMQCQNTSNTDKDTAPSTSTAVVAPTPRRGRVRVVPPGCATQQASFRPVVREISGSSQTKAHAEPTPVCVRTAPVVPALSSVTLRGIEVADVPAALAVTGSSPLSSAVPSAQAPFASTPSAFVTPKRGQFVPRLDLKTANQAHERIRAAQAPGIQSLLQLRPQMVR